MKAAGTAWATVLVAGSVVLFAGAQEPPERPPVRVTIRDDKPTQVELGLGIDPVQHAQLTGMAARAASVRK